MKVLIGARCVTDMGAFVEEADAIEVCIPAVMAVESEANVRHGAIAEALEAAMHNLAGYGPGSVLLYSTLPNCEWNRVEGRGFDSKVADIAREVAEGVFGELFYITKPGLYHVEIYRVESI